ncbi:hypothetical protein F4802DRAFT_599634 [Xylaria palmicola]|nr:hypothetical protein F4802DRAFT_599634 [Xylaria palmicola]
MILLKRVLAFTFLLTARTYAYEDTLGYHVDGHDDFHFIVTLPEPGPSFATASPPEGPITIQDFLNGPPLIRLIQLPANSSAWQAQFISFITLSSNGTLLGGADEGTGRWPHHPEQDTTEGVYRDASLNVWLQTSYFTTMLYYDPARKKDIWGDVLFAWLEEIKMPPSSGFLHSNIDFGLYNATTSNTTTNLAPSRQSPRGGLLSLCIAAPLLAMHTL